MTHSCETRPSPAVREITSHRQFLGEVSRNPRVLRHLFAWSRSIWLGAADKHGSRRRPIPYSDDVDALIGERAETRVRSRLAWGGTVAMLVLALAAVIVIWAVAVPVGPEVCALTYPGPRNCVAADRISAGIVWTTVLGVLTIALSLALMLGRTRRRAVVAAGLVLVAVASIASYLAVAWIPALA